MVRRATWVLFFLCAGFARAEDTTTTAPEDASPRRALNNVFRGRVVKVDKGRVTLFYDFEDPAQLLDFEDARPPRLLDASRNRVRVEAGRLVLEGSSAIRHKMESRGELRAVFYLRPGAQKNVGTVFTEPVLSDFFVCLNLFDQRFYKSGALLLAACGLHEDEGADVDMSLVNWRDIFSANVVKEAPVGKEVEVEVAKNGWEEYCRVGDVEGKGSSKGKTKKMDAYQFGLWVHQSQMTVDDLTIILEPTEEFLELNGLALVVTSEWEEEAPSEGPLKGIAGVAPRVRGKIEAYAEGGGDAAEMVGVLLDARLPAAAREVVTGLLCERATPRIVPLVVEALYSPEKAIRKAAIEVVRRFTGKTFGYSATAPETTRRKAIQSLNEHLAENRDRYYG